MPAGDVDEIVVLSVGGTQPGRPDPTRARMDRIAAELRYFGFTVTCQTHGGKLTSAVAQVSRARDVSLIVIGSGWGRRPSGSHSSSIAGAVRRASHRPVLVIPAVDA